MKYTCAWKFFSAKNENKKLGRLAMVRLIWFALESNGAISRHPPSVSRILRLSIYDEPVAIGVGLLAMCSPMID